MFKLRTFFSHRSFTIISRVGALLVFLSLFAAAISVVYSYYINKSQKETQVAARELMLSGHERTLKAAVISLAETLSEMVSETVADGGDQEDQIRQVINDVRYEENGYYFVYNTDGINIAHPFHPEFRGQRRLEIEDNEGHRYIKELSDKALAGGGFVTYNFYKPGQTTLLPKLVYAHMIPGTKYWLASGLYINDIVKEQQRISQRFAKIHRHAIVTVGAGVVIVLIFVVLPVSILMINSILKPWRQLERELMQAQKMEAIGIFAGGIAHDFSNVLGAITACSELAMYDTDKESPVYEDLQHIHKAAKRGKSLVRRIKEFSRKADTPRSAVNLARVTEECMELVQTILPANVDVHVSMLVDNIRVKADPDQLLQVIMNLCTNAEQAMRGFKAVLTVELDAVELDADEARAMNLKAGSYARLSVQDTGVGMKPVILKRIFEPFYTTRRKSRGTGLGLSMTQSIVTMHGGAITVNSSLGKGSVFRVLLPCVEEEHEHIPAARRLDLPHGTESLLIVDDDKDLLSSLHKLFTRLGYTVTSCNDSRDALDIFLHAPHDFDLLLTDQLMPKMTGAELIKEIKQINGDLPIILCSGFEGDGRLQRVPKDLKKAGVSAFFRKPFDTIEICRAVRKLLDQNKPDTTTMTHEANTNGARTHH
ncbi:cache domain-containing protein [Oceanidesulfovibrio marinus]|uniref:histidine kinase n=1 Tax=Oceanidesulfovibrio marinus TaxID=370038 RepID=A0A6P1ZHR3_9BACT|nr:cache domain-containing protein [Oceanidesulfovibrio marinus]TVM33813.1 hypothetical protein DQK91_11410 [Oceanidesulfovibrio marinus]